MVRTIINGTTYQIQTKWKEVDPVALVACNDFRDELKALTTIPAAIIDKATELQLWPVYTCLSFIDDLDSYPFEDAVAVDRESYQKLELARKALQVGKPYKKIINVALVYYPDEKDPVRLIGLGVSLVSQISLFLANYKDMLESGPGLKEEAAGIGELAGFGSWAAAYNLSGRDLTKVSVVLELSAIKVYTALYYSWKESEYLKRLHEKK